MTRSKLTPTLSVALKLRQAYGQCPSPCLIRIETTTLKHCSPTLLVHLRCGASAPTPSTDYVSGFDR